MRIDLSWHSRGEGVLAWRQIRSWRSCRLATLAEFLDKKEKTKKERKRENKKESEKKEIRKHDEEKGEVKVTTC